MSGDMYSGDPQKLWARSLGPKLSRERPKSVNLTCPERSSKMFSGYRCMCVMRYFAYLEISVHDIVFMEVLKGQHYLDEIEFRDCFRKLPMLGYQEEELSSGAEFQNEMQIVRLNTGYFDMLTYRLKCAVYLYYEWVLACLKSLQDAPLSHYLSDLVVFLDFVLAHYLHGIEQPGDLVSN